MRAEEFKQLLQARPFRPLRVFMTDGRTYDIRHPDQVMVMRQALDIGLQPDPVSGIFEGAHRCSLLHVVRVEEVHATPTDGAPPGANGA
jgi:hypothetical protein